jgi:hypothetical protein
MRRERVYREDELGPGHLLVRRSLAAARGRPEGEIYFEEPLRTWRGSVARGSHLHNGRILKKLLTWARPELQPDLAIVLVDCDGDRQRKPRLTAALQDRVTPHVIGVAVQEFEPWLIADTACVAKELHRELAHVRI